MKVFHSVRKLASAKKKPSAALKYAVIYLTNRPAGQRFRYRSLKTVRRWNPAVQNSLDDRDRRISFSNARDITHDEENFMVFALSCENLCGNEVIIRLCISVRNVGLLLVMISKGFFSAAILQPDFCSDLILELNLADGAIPGTYEDLVKLFGSHVAWGTELVRDYRGLSALEEKMSMLRNECYKSKELQTALTAHSVKVEGQLSSIQSSILLLREERKERDYLELANAARKCKNPAPFRSVQEAEDFLSASPAAMDGLKAVCGQQNFAVQWKKRNAQRREEGKPFPARPYSTFSSHGTLRRN